MYNGRTFVYTIENECGETVKVFSDKGCNFLNHFNITDAIQSEDVDNTVHLTYPIAFLSLKQYVYAETAMKLFIRMWVWDQTENTYLKGYKASYKKMREKYLVHKKEFMNEVLMALFTLE